jgi:hypothetical protein
MGFDTDTRRAGSVVQAVRDFVAPAPRSDWGRTLVDIRITLYDGIRPFATRGVLLASVAVAFLFTPGTAVWAFVCLVPAAVQVALEIVLEPVVAKRSERRALEEGRGRSHVRRLVTIWYRNYERGLTNFTGVLGGAACFLLLVAVVFGTGTGADWRRVAALVAGVLYLNSACLGVVLDAAVFSPLGRRVPPALARALPLLWLVPAVLVETGLLLSELWRGTWGSSLPYAIGAGLLPYAVGLRFRDYWRDAEAGREVHRLFVLERDKRVARDLHSLLQVTKGTLEAAEQALEDPGERRKFKLFRLDVEDVYRAARSRETDPDVGLLPPVTTHLRRIAAEGVLRLTHSVEIADLPPDDLWLAKQVLVTLTDNARQAYDSYPTADRVLRATAAAAEGRVRVEVSDSLPPIPHDVWERSLTLTHLRADLKAVGGSLEQRRDDAGKTLVASWPLTVQPLRKLTGEERIGP